MARLALAPYPQRAKRVIFLFMKGGPSQVDTFDFKPALQRDHGKPCLLTSPKFSSPRPETCLPRPGLSTDTARAVMPSASFFRICRIMRMSSSFPFTPSRDNLAHGAATLKLHTGSDNLIRTRNGCMGVLRFGERKRKPSRLRDHLSNPRPWRGSKLGGRLFCRPCTKDVR